MIIFRPRGQPRPPSGCPDGDMECEVEGSGAGLDGGDAVAPLRVVEAAALGSVGDGRGGGTAFHGTGGWGSLGAAAGAGRPGWRGGLGFGAGGKPDNKKLVLKTENFG